MKKIIGFIFGILIYFLFSPSETFAATRIWDGGGLTNDWSEDANWSSDTEPTSSDDVVFDNTSDKNSTVDATFTGTVISVSINSGYDGTITLQRSLQTTGAFTQSSGTFTAADQTLTVSGAFTMNSGSIFTASSTTTAFVGNFTVNGGTFNHNDGTAAFTATPGSRTTSCNNIDFNLVTLSSGTSRTVSSNCDLPLGSNPTTGIPLTLEGTLSGTGTLAPNATILYNPTAELEGFTGYTSSASSNMSVAGANLDFSTYSTFTMSGTVTLSSGTLTLPNGADLNNTLTISGGTFNAPSGNMTLAGALTISGSPTFNANVGTITFDGGTATLSCNNVAFNVIAFNNTGTKTVSSDCNLPLGDNPTMSGGQITVNGELSGSGTLNKSTGSMVFNSGSALSDFSGLVVSSGNLVISGATLDLSSHTTPLTVGSTLTISSGSFTLPSGGAQLNGISLSGGTLTASSGTTTVASLTISGSPTFNHNGGTFTFNGSTSASFTSSIDVSFYNLAKNNAVTTVTPTFTFPANRTITVLGTLSLIGTNNRRSTLNLVSSSSGNQWNIDARGPRNLSHLTVRDSNNINSLTMLAQNSVDNGNNTNWLFTGNAGVPTPLQFSLDYPGGDSQLVQTLPNPTLRWKKAVSNANSSVVKYELYIQPKRNDSIQYNTGEALFIDNIVPYVTPHNGNVMSLSYTLPTYSIRDDGEYLNLDIDSNYYQIPLGMINWRVVAIDTAGNRQEEYVDFWMDPTTLPSPKPKVNTKLISVKPISEATDTKLVSPQPTAKPVPTPLPTAEPTPATDTVENLNIFQRFIRWLGALFQS